MKNIYTFEEKAKYYEILGDIEKYINGISTKVKVDWTDLKNNHDTLAGRKSLY